MELLHQEALGGQVGAIARESQACCDVVHAFDIQVKASSCGHFKVMLHCLQA